MEDLTNEQILEKYEQLPHDLKEAIFSVGTTEIVKKIGEKYKLHIDKIGELANETGMVMFGATRPKEFIPNISERLEVDMETAIKIAEDINAQVFAKTRESLKKIHGIGEIDRTPSVEHISPTSSNVREELLKEIEKDDVQDHQIPEVFKGSNKPDPYREPIE